MFPLLDEHDRATAAKGKLNAILQELATVRLDWHPGYKGRYCRYRGDDYDLAEGGDPGDVPDAEVTGWVRRKKPGEIPMVEGRYKTRGGFAELKAVPAELPIDYFIVEGEGLVDGRDVNGLYWRLAVDRARIWARFA